MWIDAATPLEKQGSSRKVCFTYKFALSGEVPRSGAGREVSIKLWVDKGNVKQMMQGRRERYCLLFWSDLGVYEVRNPRDLEASEDGCRVIEGSKMLTRASSKGEMTVKAIDQNSESANIPFLKDSSRQRK